MNFMIYINEEERMMIDKLNKGSRSFLIRELIRERYKKEFPEKEK